MKRIGVIGNPGGWSSERLADAIEKRTGFRMLVDTTGMVLDLNAGTVRHDGLDLLDLDAVVIKKTGRQYAPEHLDRLEMLRFLAGRGIPVMSDPLRIARVLNRLTCTVTLRMHGLPMPPTTITENLDEAVDAAKRFGRSVLKPLLSTKARGMEVVDAGNGVREQIRRFRENGNPILYLQKMIDLHNRDLAVAFLGGEYVGTYARIKGDGSWNTTVRSGGCYRSHDASPAIIELARSAQEPFGLDFTSVDIAESEDGPVIFEVSAFGGYRGLLEGCGIDAADRYAEYVLNRIGHG